MTSLFTARRRAEDFATAVDSDARRTGMHNADLAQLVGVVGALRSYPQAAPHPEFAADLRARLMTEAATVLTPENVSLLLPVRTRGARERRFVAAASAAVLIGGAATMAVAAQNALPGEALYPVKRGIESAQAELSISSAGKGQDLLDQANDRLVEVEGLLASDSVQSTPQIPDTLNEFSAQATEGAGLLLESFRQTRDPSSVVEVRTFAADGLATLQQIAGSVPPDAQDELAAAAITLGDIDQQAAVLCSACTPGLPDLQVPGTFLARAEVNRAMQLAAYQELDNSHPVVLNPDAFQVVGDADTPDATVPSSDTSTSPLLSAPDLIPGTDDPVSGTEPDASGGTVQDGLSGVVETLLPEPGAVETLLPVTDVVEQLP